MTGNTAMPTMGSVDNDHKKARTDTLSQSHSRTGMHLTTAADSEPFSLLTPPPSHCGGRGSSPVGGGGASLPRLYVDVASLAAASPLHWLAGRGEGARRGDCSDLCRLC